MADKKLNDKQKKWVEDNLGLVYSYLRDKHLSREVYEDLLYIALCEGALRYDPNKSYNISSYVYLLFDHALFTNSRNANRQCRKLENPLIYLDNEDLYSDDGEIGDYRDCIESKTVSVRTKESIDSYICTMAAYHQWKQGLTKEDRKLVDSMIDGMSQTEYAKANKVCRQAISSQLKRLRRSFEAAMKGKPYVLHKKFYN